MACGFARGDFLVHPRLQVGDFRADRIALRRLAGLLRRHVRRFLRDLRAPAFRSFGRLLQRDELEFEIVHAALLRTHRQSFGVPGLLLRLQVFVDGIARVAGRGRDCRRRRDQRRQFVEFALTRNDAVQFAVGGEQRDSLRGDEMAGRRDERLAFAERLAIRQCRAQVRAAANAMQAVREQASGFRLLETHLGKQRIVAVLGRMARGQWRERRNPSRRRRAAVHPMADIVQTREFERVEPLAQHGLQRVFPSQLDVQRLPQPARLREAVVRQPAVDILSVPDLRLQR